MKRAKTLTFLMWPISSMERGAERPSEELMPTEEYGVQVRSLALLIPFQVCRN